jgi:hypothetical protein
MRIPFKTARYRGISWARATQWVSENSYFKLRIANDSTITTEGPLNNATMAHNSAV